MKYYVYIIGIEGSNVCKVGYTKESKGPEVRKSELETGCPYNLEVRASYLTEYGSKIEKIMHRHYAPKKTDEDMNNLRGEWFYLEEEDVKKFQEECEKTESNIRTIIESSTMDDPLKYM